MTTYQVMFNGVVLRDDGASIPPDPRNSDYAAYLAWVDAGNVAEVLPEPHPTAAERVVLNANSNSIRNGLNAAIANNIAAAAIITAIGTKANGYANNPSTNLSTTVLTGALKDVCAGIATTCQAILECEKQLVGLERLILGQLDTTTGA